MKLPKNELLTKQEVADFLHVSPLTVHRYCQDGKVIWHRLNGRDIRIERDSIVNLFHDKEWYKNKVERNKKLRAPISGREEEIRKELTI